MNVTDRSDQSILSQTTVFDHQFPVQTLISLSESFRQSKFLLWLSESNSYEPPYYQKPPAPPETKLR